VSYDNDQFDYVYNYVDHLGNVRLSYTDVNWNGSIDPSTEIIQEKNYYPFGLTHQGYNHTIRPLGSDAAKNYLFGGKELQDENDLTWYDITARNYDPALGRWMNLDPLAEQMRRHSPYNYAFDNPIFFIDPDGMSPISVSEDPIYNNKGKLIGDDGLDNGKIHIVYNKDQAKDIKSQTKAGNNAINLEGVEKVTLNGGASTVDGVVASVEAQSSDTGRYPGSSDAGLHEEGGHTEVDANGNVATVTWEPGPKKSETGNGTIDLFNGIAPREYPTSSELADYWHVHTSKTQEVEQADGTVRTYRGSMGPSGTPGSAGGDIGTAQNLENNGYNATAIQVGTSAGKKVNFYSGGGVITTMSLKNFKKLKND
jgi:RHS repeat-associated protein